VVKKGGSYKECTGGGNMRNDHDVKKDQVKYTDSPKHTESMSSGGGMDGKVQSNGTEMVGNGRQGWKLEGDPTNQMPSIKNPRGALKTGTDKLGTSNRASSPSQSGKAKGWDL